MSADHFKLLIDKASGATTMLRNDFDGKTFTFTNIGVVTGAATCTAGYGYELHDIGVRWHDLDGDGIDISLIFLTSWATLMVLQGVLIFCACNKTA